MLFRSLPWEIDVVEIPPAPPHEARILEAADGLADPELAHGQPITSGRNNGQIVKF